VIGLACDVNAAKEDDNISLHLALIVNAAKKADSVVTVASGRSDVGKEMNRIPVRHRLA